MMIEIRKSYQPGPHAKLVGRLLRPKSLAIIGFSAKQGAMGATTLALLDRDGFSGDIHLVGRSGGMASGRPVLTSPDELPRGIDLAVLTLPSVAVLDAVKACIRMGVGSIVIFASGFAELGDEGREAQAAITTLAEEAGIGIAGPNCLGFVNYVDGVEVGFLPGPPLKPMPRTAKFGVAIVGHSGGLMGHILWALQAHCVPVSYQISTGNEAGLCLSDYIAYLADDTAVGIIAVYAEQIRRPAEFLNAVGRARAAGKIIILLHAGRSQRAQKAAASHSGALAGDYAVMKAAVSHAGVLVVDSIEELVDCAEFLARYPIPPRAYPAIVTTSGAMCAIAHDTCEDIGLTLPALPSQTWAILRERLPSYIMPENPCDLGTMLATDSEILPFTGKALLAEPTIGGLVIITPTGAESIAMSWLPGAIEIVRDCDKPVLLAVMGDDHPFPPKFVEMARAAGMLLFRSAERALRTISRITAYARSIDRGFAEDVALPFDNLAMFSAGPLPEWRGKAVLRDIGVVIPNGGLAKNADEAVAVAIRIGYPVVVKIQAAHLTHKTEVGGVILNISNEAELRVACATAFERAAKAVQGMAFDGLLIEEMSAKGVELVVGAKRDQNWGPVLIVGLGGVAVEVLGDVRLLPPDLDKAAIIEELHKLKSAKLLGAFRGVAPRDVDAIAATIMAVGRLMTTCPDILEIDINPLVALASGDGVCALDALVIIR